MHAASRISLRYHTITVKAPSTLRFEATCQHRQQKNNQWIPVTIYQEGKFSLQLLSWSKHTSASLSPSLIIH